MNFTANEIVDMHMSNVIKELVRCNLAKTAIGTRIKISPSMRKHDMVVEKIGDDNFVIVREDKIKKGI